MCVCFYVFRALSDGDSEFLQHADSFLLVLLAGQPEVVLVLHDVGQHGSAQEHHVLSPGRVLDADLEFLKKQRDMKTSITALCNKEISCRPKLTVSNQTTYVTVHN